MKKKVTLPIVITIALITATLTFSAAYLLATGVINKKLTDLGEKQALFSTLSDVDSYVREKYQGEIDEAKLTEELCRGYAEAFDGELLYLTAEEYKNSDYNAENGYLVLELSDGSAMVVLSEGQATLPATTASETETTTATE